MFLCQAAGFQSLFLRICFLSDFLTLYACWDPLNALLDYLIVSHNSVKLMFILFFSFLLL